MTATSPRPRIQYLGILIAVPFETCGEQPVIYLLAALMIAGNLATRAAEMRTLLNPPNLHIHLGGRVPW
jgi:hypothetical protein